MKTYFQIFQDILRDSKAIQLFLIVIVVCVINFALSWFGLVTLLVTFATVSSAFFFLKNVDARQKVQRALTSRLELDFDSAIQQQQQPPDSGNILVDKELDASVESFFKAIIKNFISSWFLSVSSDETFVWNIKQQVAESVRNFVLRVEKLNHAELISTKLLPVVYSHVEILQRINQNGHSPEHQQQAISAFIENENPIHPATYNRTAELEYLRDFSGNILKLLVSPNNLDCKIIVDLLKEVLTCTVFLPLLDVVSDPGTINHLVILATDQKVVQRAPPKTSKEKKVVLLENFVKQFKMSLSDEVVGDELGGNFFRDQEKLYSFMQYLKSKSHRDIELLKFYLDVEHLNAELGNYEVISNPAKLSTLQQKSEKLLVFFQTHLFKGDETEKAPDDLHKAHALIKRKLEEKWKNEFYKSAEYFQLIYADRTYSHIPEVSRRSDSVDSVATHQKFSSKFKNAMSIRTGTVEGIEATEIPIWDALDHPLGNTSYYNSMAVKLRKERGQDLDNFMKTFFESIEQEADLGEDIAASTQSKEDELRQKKKSHHLGNVELYRNLFNISGQSAGWQSGADVKSPVDSAIYFVTSILKFHDIFVRIFSGLLRLLPDADNIVCLMMRKLLNKLLSQRIMAELICELEKKVFNTPPSPLPSPEELKHRRDLATTRIECVNKNLGAILSHFQNPVLNKHLMYCLLDLIAIEIFPELNLAAKD